MLLTVLFALLSASAISAFPKPPQQQVPPQCVDPTFACQDLESARLCGVVKSCIHDIWSTINAPDDNDEICDLCKEMVKEARDQLLSNMTQEEIKEVFEGSCKLLPIKIVADGCIKVVDEIIPELVEMLASRMDPNMVCTVSGLCNVAHLPIQSQIVKVFRKIVTNFDADQCAECTTMMTDVKVFLKSMPEAQVKTYAEQICDEKVPSYLCDILIGKYFSEIYAYVTSNDPKQMCTEAGVCKKSCEPSEEKSAKVEDELTCEFCTHVLEHIKDEIIANTTVEEFRTALLNFCKHMGSFSDKCTSVVNDYYDMLFDLIRKLDTKEFCTLIGLCNNNDSRCAITPLVQILPPLETRNRIPLTKIQPAQRITENDIHPLVKVIPAVMKNKKEMAESNEIFPSSENNALPLERFSHPILNFERDTECAFCKAITFYIQQDLKGDRSKAGIQKAMSNVCEKWVKEFPEHCENFLNKYSQKVTFAIAEDMEFDNICSQVKACPLEGKNREVEVKVISKVGEGPFCDLCKDAMKEVEAKLKDPQTKKEIENLLFQVCNVIPSLKDDCQAFIDQNIDAALSMLEQELTPDNVCPALKFCTGTPRIPPPQIVNDLECDLCKEAVTSLREKMQDPAVKQAVLVFMEEGCARLPGSLAPECKTFVDENIDTVIAVIIQTMDPDTVCSILKICPAKMRRVSAPRVGDVQCDLCKQVIGQVEDLIKDKKTEDEIQKALDEVCSILPSSLKDQCDNFVNTYTPTIITLLMQELDPDTVCAMLNVCPKKVRVSAPRVGDVQCDLCKQVIGQVEDLIKDQKTEAEIQKALDVVCSILPSSLKDKCDNFVNTYTATIITLLMQELDPDTVCAMLNVCPNKEHYDEWLAKAVDVECQSCQYALHFLQEQLQSADTQAEVKNVLKQVCDMLPQTYAQNCESFVDEYGSAFLAILAQEIDPSILCWELQMCHNQTKLFTSRVKTPALKSSECELCTQIVDYMDQLLENDDIDQEITKLVEKVCSVVPNSQLRDKCNTLVATYGPYLLQMIGQMANSKEVCQEIDLCERLAGQVHLLGGHKCTFGPSYWCQSSAHAAACKAEMFCRQRVWVK